MIRPTTLAVVGTALLGSAAAQATAVYQAQSFGPSTTAFTSNPPLSFNAFDTTLGMLTSVEFNINDSSSTYQGTLTNNGQNTITSETLSIATNLAIGATASTPASLTGLSYSTPTVQFPFSNIAPGQTVAFGPTTQASPSNNATFFIPAASLTQFEQGGSFTLTVNGTSPFSLASGSSESVSDLVTASGMISLEYDYTPTAVTPPSPVPEPASLALLGISLLGAGLVRRRT